MQSETEKNPLWFNMLVIGHLIIGIGLIIFWRPHDSLLYSIPFCLMLVMLPPLMIFIGLHAAAIPTSAWLFLLLVVGTATILSILLAVNGADSDKMSVFWRLGGILFVLSAVWQHIRDKVNVTRSIELFYMLGAFSFGLIGALLSKPHDMAYVAKESLEIISGLFILISTVAAIKILFSSVDLEEVRAAFKANEQES